MAIAKQSLVASEVKKALHALSGDARDYDPLLKLIQGARFCLLGEATHGTQEFYRERAEITKRLIKEQGFTAVAVEADWPDAFRVNRYVRGLSDDRNANEALGGFKRFPICQSLIRRCSFASQSIGSLKHYWIRQSRPCSGFPEAAAGSKSASGSAGIGRCTDTIPKST